MIFPNQEDLLMFDPTSLTVINVLKLKCYAQKVIHRNYTEPNFCHHKMGPMATQEFTVAKQAILT